MTGSWNGTSYLGDDTNDIAVGTAADNYMAGNKGDDNLKGMDGNDAIDGGVGHDDLEGGDGNDRLWDFTGTPPGFVGLIGHDTLRGGEGDDHLNIWSPDTGDIANGGAGFDTVEIRFNYGNVVFTHGISFVLGKAPSVAQVNGVNTVAVSQMERMVFVANNGNDFVSGGENNDTISGLGGNDTLLGNDGDDQLEDGAGVVNVDGGRGVDMVSFDLSAASDDLEIESGRNVSLGAWGSIRNCERFWIMATGAGDDVFKIEQSEGVILAANAGSDKITLTGIGADAVQAGSGADVINTGGGNDNVDPGAGADRIFLGEGADRCDYTATGSRLSTEADQAYGQDGNDTIFLAAGDDLIDGGTGIDSLYSGAGADTILGGADGDRMEGEGGADRLEGGEGNDAISADWDASAGATTRDNDRLYGGNGNDEVTGGVGRDIVSGDAGDDMVNFSPFETSGAADLAIDELMGGDGLDTLQLFGSFGTAQHAWKIVFGPDIMVKLDGQAVAHAVGFERLIVNGNNDGNHNVTASELNDSILSGSGDSIFRMLGGADTVWAGAGSDLVVAGAGADNVVLHVGGADRVDLGSKNDSMILYDYLAAADLAGGIGGAVYDGGKGVDSIELWFNNTPGLALDGQTIRYNGTAIGTITGFETVKFNGLAPGGLYNGTSGADYVNLTGGDNTINGNGGADTLMAAGGADTLNGGSGDDRLTGGGGADRLTGGADADAFIYTLISQSGGATIDLITDFGTGADKIDLFSIDADTVSFGNQAFHLGGGGGHAGDIVLTYDSVNNRTAVDLYVNADATIDATLWLSGNHTGLTDTAFVL